MELQGGMCLCQGGFAQQSPSQCVGFQTLIPFDQTVSESAATSTFYAIYACAIPIVLFSSPALMIQLFDILQILRYILYVQVDYPKPVVDFFNLFGAALNFEFLPDIIPAKLDPMRAPKGFQKNGLDGLFLRNVQQYIVIGGFLLAIYAIARLFILVIDRFQQDGTKPFSLMRAIAQRIVDAYEYSVLIYFLQNALMTITIFAMVQIRDSACRNYLQSISFLAGYASFLLATFLPAIVYSQARGLLRSTYSEKEVRVAYEQKYGMLFEVFRKKSIYTVGFYVLMMLRKYAFALMLVFANDLPVLNLVGFIAANFGLVYALWKVRPYEQNSLLYRDTASEIGFALIHISTLFLFSKHVDRTAIGRAIVAFCWLVLGAELVFILQETYHTLVRLYRKAFAKKKPQEEAKVQDRRRKEHLGTKFISFKNPPHFSPDRIPATQNV